MSRRTSIVATAVVVALAIAVVALYGSLTTSAIQNPRMDFDMVTAGNTYDEATNTMTVGTIEPCLETPPPGTNTLHIHAVHLVIRQVEDLVGWQARLNYDGSDMRPSTVTFTPFTDNTTGQNISFLSLPIDQISGVHRDQVNATDIPAAAAGPQTALIGSVYQGEQSFPISPDSPHKTTPDDASYNAPSGGVLATVNLQVLAGNAGQGLIVDMDDSVPNIPGSDLQIFNGTGITTMSLAESALGDALHGEGAACPTQATPGTVTPTAPPVTPTATPTAPPVTPTATPTAAPVTPTATPTAPAVTGTPTATPPPVTATATATATAGAGPQPESTTAAVAAGETATTDDEADGATADDPVETDVTPPTAGTVTITEGAITQGAPAGVVFIGQEVNITIDPTPPADPNNPIVIAFTLDSSLGVTTSNAQVYKNGVLVADCTAAGIASPDPCVESRVASGDDVVITVLSTTPNPWNFALSVVGTGTATATPDAGTGTATATPDAGTGTATATPDAGTATATASPTATATATATATPVGTATPTRTPAPQLGLDHFKCYETDRADGAERFESRSVDVVDLFTEETLRLSKPEAGCFPADKNNEGVNDETAHLLCYQLSRNRENVDENVRISNQFGELELHVHRAELFCVPAEADGVTSALALDHFKCYNAHRDGGPRFNSRGGVILEDRFGTDTVKVDNVETFCTPADKENEGILDPDTALVCYDLDNGDDQDEDVTFEDQFGEVTVEIEDTEELCVPSTFEVLTEDEEDDDDDDDDDD